MRHPQGFGELPRPRKCFGQHFLHDPKVCARIIAELGAQAADHFVEIGPGRGALTIPLLRILGKLDAIELDRELIPYLQHQCIDLGELRIYHQDALDFDFTLLPGRLRLIGNLPYNIATELLFRILDQIPATEIQDMHFMVQREVAERITALPGNSAYGRLSVMVQYRCQVERLFTVGAGAFHPPPKVESTLIRLRPYVIRPVIINDERCFALLVRQAFSQRRKTVKNTLRTLLTEGQIRSADVDPSVRPETLTIGQFANLARLIQQ